MFVPRCGVGASSEVRTQSLKFPSCDGSTTLCLEHPENFSRHLAAERKRNMKKLNPDMFVSLSLKNRPHLVSSILWVAKPFSTFLLFGVENYTDVVSKRSTCWHVSKLNTLILTTENAEDEAPLISEVWSFARLLEAEPAKDQLQVGQKGPWLQVKVWL